MTSDEAATVFDDFTQATRHTQQQYGGTGLGLSISRRMAKVMGGEIKLKSKQGSGSTFTVRLPAPLAESETSAESVDNPA
jgi:signal transduction histidine kinase